MEILDFLRIDVTSNLTISRKVKVRNYIYVNNSTVRHFVPLNAELKCKICYLFKFFYVLQHTRY